MAIKICCVDGCWKPVKTKGFCHNHYMMQYLYGRTKKVIKGDRRDHPFYMLWWDRKNAKVLCEEWLDFDTFIKDISPKPEGNYFLARIDDKPYGPNNFKWIEHLKRKPGELKKDWYARKWAARQLANPGMERARNFKRSYGITIEQYNEILLKQNNVCAICGNGELSRNKNGGQKKLAVDHCHNSKKIRGLLCWRCNSTLGKIEDNIELLDKMKTYLLKHNGV